MPRLTWFPFATASVSVSPIRIVGSVLQVKYPQLQLPNWTVLIFSLLFLLFSFLLSFILFFSLSSFFSFSLPFLFLRYRFYLFWTKNNTMGKIEWMFTPSLWPYSTKKLNSMSHTWNTAYSKNICSLLAILHEIKWERHIYVSREQHVNQCLGCSCLCQVLTYWYHFPGSKCITEQSRCRPSFKELTFWHEKVKKCPFLLLTGGDQKSIPVKGQVVNASGFVKLGPLFLCPCSECSCGPYVNGGHGHVPVKLYVQKQLSGCIWPKRPNVTLGLYLSLLTINLQCRPLRFTSFKVFFFYWCWLQFQLFNSSFLAHPYFKKHQKQHLSNSVDTQPSLHTSSVIIPMNPNKCKVDRRRRAEYMS